MSPFPFSRPFVRVLALTGMLVLLVSISLMWTSRQQAGSSSLKAARGDSRPTLFAAKSDITPDAATITVNSLSDVANPSDGLCTLREAITAANSNTVSGAVAGECPAGSSSGSDVINFSVIGIINLTTPLPSLSSDMTIIGPGSAQLTVRRNSGGDYPILTIRNGTINISGLTVTNGKGPNGGLHQQGGDGGGIINIATLTMTDIVVTSNHAGMAGEDITGRRGGSGGGIANYGALIMTNCVVTANFSGDGYPGTPDAGGLGGGIYSSGSLTITKSDVSGNRTGSGYPNGDGGGIFSSGNLIVTAVTINNNNVNAVSADGYSGNGGGLYSFLNTALVTDCTISGNHAGGGTGGYGRGGAIVVNRANMTVSNSTISNNTSAGGAITNGEFCCSLGGVLSVNNSTISGNHSMGILNSQAGSTTQVRSTLKLTNSTIVQNDLLGIDDGNDGIAWLRNNVIALNNSSGASDLSGGSLISFGHNLIGKSDGSMTASNGDQVGTTGSPINPQLGPLANNGGPTKTHALLPNSPALDAGDNCVAEAAHCGDADSSTLTTDQRVSGFSRIVDGPDGDTTATVDIGAYEMQTPLANLPDTSTNEDTQLVVSFDGGDTSTITSVTATSSNTSLVPNDAAHLSAAITGTTGVVTINPVTNSSGTTNITVTVNRTGGPESKTFMVTVNSVNDAPSFVKGADQTVNEDAAAQMVNNWAVSISPGPADESGQTLEFQVTGNTNAALFAVAPAVSVDGTLTYTPAADANGSATITVTLKDNGGTANGGVDTSTQTFTVTVNSVNDAPTFTAGPNQTVNNNAGPQTIPNWATNISAGPANESSQTRTFSIVSNTNPTLFSVAPAVSSNGTLSFQPAPDQGGTATILVQLQDNGGSANGGVDKSTAVLNITVVPVGGVVNFASSSGSTTEDSGSVNINVVRTGDTSKAVTVDYATNGDSGLPCSTASGVASPKCDFTAALGTLNFAAGETTKPITILISQDSFVEGPENITVTLSNATGGSTLGTPASMPITIADDATEPPTNVIDNAGMFVRMHYHDFLNREADQSGLGFWTGQMSNCGASDLIVCRVNVSASFFLSIEFQQTGYLVERIYKVGYGEATATSTLGGSHQVIVPVVRANEFLTDTQRIGRGVIVLQPGWEQALENNKQAYALEFVQTTRFITALPTSRTPTQFVDQLNQNAGMVLSPSERTTAINAFGIAANTSNVNARAQVLRQIADDHDLYNAEFNRAFVLTEYFGYLRRNPNDAPESTLDYTGYEFWLSKLNQFNGDYIAAEMVKAFISANEYRQRFGP